MTIDELIVKKEKECEALKEVRDAQYASTSIAYYNGCIDSILSFIEDIKLLK